MGACTCHKKPGTQKSNIPENPPNKRRDEDPEIIIDLERQRTKRLEGKSESTSQIQEVPDSTELTHSKTPEEKEFLRRALQENILFRKFPDNLIKGLIGTMSLISLEAEKLVYNENDKCLSFFLLYTGGLRSYTKKKEELINPGSFFGESALLENTVRDSTVVTTQQSFIWKISRKDYFNVIKTSSSESYLKFITFVNSVPSLNDLTASQKEKLSEILKEAKFSDGKHIIKEGEYGDVLYFINQGTVKCTKANKEIRRMHVGDYFGEQALLYDVPRTATVTAVGNVSVLKIAGDALVRTLGDNLSTIIYNNSIKIAFEHHSKFSHLFKEEVDLLLKHVQIFTLSKREQLPPNESAIWIVLKGRLSSRDRAHTVDRFGIVEETNQEYFALTDCDIGCLEDVNEILGKDLNQAIMINSITQSLMNVKILKSLPLLELQSVAKRMALRSYGPGESIITEGEPGTEFFIIKSGNVSVRKDGVYLRALEEGAYFGERAILLNENRTASILTNTSTECWVLTREDFLEFADEDLLEFLRNRMLLQDDSLTLDNLYFVKKLGEGSFGNVNLVVNPSNRALYCLKTVPIRKIIEFKLFNSIMMERKILLQIDHPLIMKLVKTFKAETKIYFLTEYVNGMEMFDVLNEVKKFNENQAMFFAACVILMLEHLHERNIIYRDLKPENIMIDNEGYAKLIDFGTAKIIEGKTTTILGTPHYMSPELICGHPYGFGADFWSLGVLIYEFFTGNVPFGNNLENPLKVYNSIINHQLTFPPVLQRFGHAVSIIKQLLNKKSVMRGDTRTIKNHSWLKDFQWANLRIRKSNSPFVPKVKGINGDVSKAIASKKPARGDPMNGSMVLPQIPIKYKNWDADF